MDRPDMIVEMARYALTTEASRLGVTVVWNEFAKH
jgi:hypothetical protein